MANIILYGVVGLFSGLSSSCWGAYKDSPYERFELPKFTRSLVIGLLLGVASYQYLEVSGIPSPNLGVFFVFVMALERLSTEILKAFVRQENQDKYYIPSKFHILGKIVENKAARLAIGTAVVLLVFLLFHLPNWLHLGIQSTFFIGLFWGIVGGIAAGLGGAWKDAPLEGLEPIKFFRSPAVGGAWGAILSFFTANPSYLMFSSMGAERMTTELYKTFITKKPPGKFMAKNPSYPEWVAKRKFLIAPYMLTWALFIALLLYGSRLQ